MKSPTWISICYVAIILLIPGLVLATTLDHEVSYSTENVETEADSCFYRVYLERYNAYTNEIGKPELPMALINLIIPRG